MLVVAPILFFLASSLSAQEILDDSDGPFRILPPTVTLISLAGGEIWPAGSARTVARSHEGLKGSLTLELYRGALLIGTIALTNSSSGELHFILDVKGFLQ
jgi:hypothetical protein